jgi:hypothetical protein
MEGGGWSAHGGGISNPVRPERATTRMYCRRPEEPRAKIVGEQGPLETEAISSKRYASGVLVE